MGANINSRRRLFYKFSNQLHLLKDNGFLNIELQFDRTYICPLCLRQFNEDDLISKPDKNFLTEEDAPPYSLGGERIALTCKECNSKAGHQIDNHLYNRIKSIDDSYFYKGSSQIRTIEYEGKQISAEITSEGNGTLKVFHRMKKNNPSLLDKFIYGIKDKSIGPILNLEPPKYKSNGHRVDTALLKTNYIIVFAQFGYIFLLNDFYNSIREQISNPDSNINKHIFISNQFIPSQIGTYYVMNPGAKSIFSIFSLKTVYSETLVGAILPILIEPKSIFESLINNGSSIGSNNVGVSLDTRNYNKNADLFQDISEISKIVKWVYY